MSFGQGGLGRRELCSTGESWVLVAYGQAGDVREGPRAKQALGRIRTSGPRLAPQLPGLGTGNPEGSTWLPLPQIAHSELH